MAYKGRAFSGRHAAAQPPGLTPDDRDHIDVIRHSVGEFGPSFHYLTPDKLPDEAVIERMRIAEMEDRYL